MRRLQTRHARSHVSRERWLVSYADFITLLFAFFATMYAISSVDSQKLSTVAHALQVAFDDSPKGRSLASGQGLLPENGVIIPDQPEQSSADVQSKISRELADELAAHRLELIVDRRGVTLSIPEAGTFAVAHDELSETAQELVRPRRRHTRRVWQFGARRRAHRRRADPQPEVCVELGPLGGPRQPRGRISDRARPQPGAAVGNRIRRVSSPRPE